MKASTFIPQKGFDSEGTAIDRFPAPEADGRVTTFTEVSDWKEVEISGNQNLSEPACHRVSSLNPMACLPSIARMRPSLS